MSLPPRLRFVIVRVPILRSWAEGLGFNPPAASVGSVFAAGLMVRHHGSVFATGSEPSWGAQLSPFLPTPSVSRGGLEFRGHRRGPLPTPFARIRHLASAEGNPCLGDRLSPARRFLG